MRFIVLQTTANRRLSQIVMVLMAISLIGACKKDENPQPDEPEPTYFTPQAPAGFPPFEVPADNPFTLEGVALGKKLFFDPILSGNNTQSCGSCHMPQKAFTDQLRFSTGIDGIMGDRNAMAVFNMAWQRDLFWNGRATSLEQLSFEPVTNPIEMHETWPNATLKLQNHPEYPGMFKAAFGNSPIDSVLVSKALSQFMRTIFSGNSRFHRAARREINPTQAELRGRDIFLREDKGDCFHCHVTSNMLFTDNTALDVVQRFHNNGLDATFSGRHGRSEVTGNPADDGKFKTPTLLNLVFTAPYMHDGRFKTLEEVIAFYDSGVHVFSPNLSPLMTKNTGGQQTVVNGKRKLNLTAQEKADLLVFLHSLTDSSLLTNPAYRP